MTVGITFHINRILAYIHAVAKTNTKAKIHSDHQDPPHTDSTPHAHAHTRKRRRFRIQCNASQTIEKNQIL